ncbi:hypothetical protein CS542_05605 [Pedobacter sp. IW39]|nr:hypothetical protein CS542_05605 [Pedobacter sp. IW39]
MKRLHNQFLQTLHLCLCSPLEKGTQSSIAPSDRNTAKQAAPRKITLELSHPDFVLFYFSCVYYFLVYHPPVVWKQQLVFGRITISSIEIEMAAVNGLSPALINNQPREPHKPPTLKDHEG